MERYEMQIIGLNEKDVIIIKEAVEAIRKTNNTPKTNIKLANEAAEIAKFWLDKFNSKDNTSSADLKYYRTRYVQNNIMRQEYEILANKDQDTDPSKLITFNCVYLDGSEGSVTAFSIEDALEKVPTGTQVF